MSELKFTPGPWRLPTPEEGKRWLARYLILDAEGGSLADATPGFPANHETKIANARLMTAAPDLLEACEALEGFDAHAQECAECDEWGANNCREGLDLMTKVYQLNRAAIAKARG